jgi:hypothetical protein
MVIVSFKDYYLEGPNEYRIFHLSMYGTRSQTGSYKAALFDAPSLGSDFEIALLALKIEVTRIRKK